MVPVILLVQTAEPTGFVVGGVITSPKDNTPTPEPYDSVKKAKFLSLRTYKIGLDNELSTFKAKLKDVASNPFILTLPLTAPR